MSNISFFVLQRYRPADENEGDYGWFGQPGGRVQENASIKKEKETLNIMIKLVQITLTIKVVLVLSELIVLVFFIRVK